MDKSYITLFNELARATAVTSEQVMDYDHGKGDEKGFQTAMTMRDDYEALKDRINETYEMNKTDAAKLLVAAYIQISQLQDRIEALKKALTGYQTDVLPKLQLIVDEAKTDEEATKMANEKFIVEDNK